MFRRLLQTILCYVRTLFVTSALTEPLGDFKSFPPTIPHRRYKGSTSSGKTNGACVDLLEIAKTGQYWITAVFPHPQFGLKFIAELYALFGDELLDRLIAERLSDTDRVIPRQFIFSSDHPDPFKRRIENDEYRSAFVDILLPMQEKVTIGDQPSKAENLDLAIGVKQNQDIWWPDSWMPYVLEDHSVHDHAKAHCTAEKELEDLKAAGRLKGKEHSMGPGSASRIMRPMGNPVIEVRCCAPENFDWIAFKNKCGIHVILGGDVSDDALRIFCCSDYQRTVRAAKKRLLRPGIIFRDEATNYGLFGNFEANTLSTGRAFGISDWHTVQIENYPTPDIAKGVNQNVEDYVLRQTDPEEALKSARSLNATRDINQVHHEDVTYRSVETGEVEILTRKSTTKGEKKSVTESEQLLPRKRDEEVRRPVFNQLSTQTEAMADSLMTSGPGECWIRPQGAAPYKKQLSLFPDSWVFPGLAEAKAEECIARLKERHPYVTPVQVPFPAPVKTTTSSESKGKKPPSQNLPKPRGRRGNSSRKG